MSKFLRGRVAIIASGVTLAVMLILCISISISKLNSFHGRSFEFEANGWGKCRWIVESVADKVASDDLRDWYRVWDAVRVPFPAYDYVSHPDFEAPNPLPERFTEDKRFGRTRSLPHMLESHKLPLFWMLDEFPSGDRGAHLGIQPHLLGKILVVFWNGKVKTMTRSDLEALLCQLGQEYQDADIEILDQWDASRRPLWRHLAHFRNSPH